MKKLLLVLFLFTAVLSKAQHNKPDTIRAFFTQEKITLDGKLTEKCWQQALKINNFNQREMYEGEPPTEKTEVAIVYTTNMMYIGFWGYDYDPDKIVAQEMTRDFDLDIDDNFEIILSTFNDNRNGYLFAVNPNGTRALIFLCRMKGLDSIKAGTGCGMRLLRLMKRDGS